MTKPNLETIRQAAEPVDYWSVRYVETTSDEISVRQNVLEPVSCDLDAGCMVTVHHKGGVGYAATADLSADGLKRAFSQARSWAERSNFVFASNRVTMPKPQGNYQTPVKKSWDSLSFKDKIDLLKKANTNLAADKRIVDFVASLWHTKTVQQFWTSDGGHTEQSFFYMCPELMAIANEGSNTQVRTMGGRGVCKQIGLEILDELDFINRAKTVGEEAVELLYADNCPTKKMDLLLAPDQMILQIHESIGHPLELDRILGDERNYAGTSFVTLDMFGNYQYGSPLLNITFDPTVTDQLASFNFDDDGMKAEKTFIIEKGILQRPLGATWSQARTGIAGVANARACNWNRPPIDRMANLNLETGESTFDEMVKNVEFGVYMEANSSWSIDDSRNKFQFGCERGRLIENGKLTKVVRNPNYRGISATFWRSLKMVGNKDTRTVMGTPNCGKGEPNQCIRVGHASPTCLFTNVEVFGGE